MESNSNPETETPPSTTAITNPIGNPNPEVASANPETPQPNPQNNSNDSKNIITIVLLLLLYPVGLIAMWGWTKWSRWIKILITLPLLLIIVLLFLSVKIYQSSPVPNPSSSPTTQQSPLPLASLSPSTVYQYTPAEEQTFLKGCTAAQSSCQCLLTYLENHISDKEILNDVANNPDAAKSLLAAGAQSCIGK